MTKELYEKIRENIIGNLSIESQLVVKEMEKNQIHTVFNDDFLLKLFCEFVILVSTNIDDFFKDEYKKILRTGLKEVDDIVNGIF